MESRIGSRALPNCRSIFGHSCAFGSSFISQLGTFASDLKVEIKSTR